MPRYSDDLISEVCAQSDIVDYVSQHVVLKKSGKDYSGLCPFHNEKTPSFHVSADKQLFHCFGCGASGNVIQFVMKTENVDFVDALKIMADRAGIVLPEDDEGFNDELREKKKKLYLMNKIAARFFYDRFKTQDGKRALAYLQDRKISSKTITAYGLGYAPPSYDALLNHLRDAGFSDDFIVEGFLASRKDGRVYDKFRDRIMFPIIDTRGNVIGFGGRIITEIKKDGMKIPKYLNSSETIVFDKGNNLFSLNLAKKSEKKQIILVEGYMDVISVYQAGIPNIVATLGTALTDNQAKLLSRYAAEVLLCYDSDEAGVKATLRAIDILNNAGLKGKVIKLKGAKDPDEYIKNNGVEAFKNCMKRAVPFIEYKIGLLKTEYDLSETEGKIGFISAVSNVLSTVNDAVEVDAYIRKVSDETEISIDAIYAEYRKKAKNAVREMTQKSNRMLARKQESVSSSKGNVRKNAEKRLLVLILQEKKLYDKVSKLIKPEDFSVPVYKKLASIIYDRRQKGEEPEAADILNEFNKTPEEVDEAAAVFYNQEVYSDKEMTAWELTKSILVGKIEQEMEESKDDSEKMQKLIMKRMELMRNKTLWLGERS